MTTFTTFQADVVVVRQGKERVDGLDNGTFVLRDLELLFRIRWRFSLGASCMSGVVDEPAPSALAPAPPVVGPGVVDVPSPVL